jgi:predicted ester cyclase
LAFDWDGGTLQVTHSVQRIESREGQPGHRTQLIADELKAPCSWRSLALTLEILAKLRRHHIRQAEHKIEQFRRAFPDLRWRVDLVLGDGDLVAARWTASGTHSGGWGDVAPTGRRATFSGVNIFRFGDEGKVVEIWNHRDDFGLREQLGAPVFAGAQPQAEER